MSAAGDIRAQLRAFKAAFDPLLADYMDAQIRKARTRNAFLADGLAQCRALLLGGGKRLRPALVTWGYEGSGGTDRAAIMRAAMSVEILHLYLLVHDDIMDRDDLRHGVPTLHAHYARQLRAVTRDAEHIGGGIAMVLGDLLCAMGNRVLFEAPFPPAHIIAALRHVQETIERTATGQLDDMRFAYTRAVSRDDILAMYGNKTAYYSIESPLLLGYILAHGACDADLAQKIHAVAHPLGIAFQLRDDVIGIFGDVAQTGKPIGSDIAAGKVTLLVAEARARATKRQRAQLDALMGKEDLTPAEVATFRAVVEDTGARAAVDATMRALIADGMAAIDALPYTAAVQARLRDLARFIAQRNV